MWAGRPLGWGPSSATTMLGTERAKSVLSVHPCPRCPWESEKAGPWGGAMSSVRMSWECMPRVRCGAGSPQAQEAPRSPVLQGHRLCRAAARSSQAPQPLAQDGQQRARRRWGGCGHQHICHPRRLAHAHPHGEGQCPAAFRSTGPDPGSCHAQQLHLLPHGPQKTRAAVGTDGCPSPPPLQRWRLRGRPNFQPRSGPGAGGSWPLIPKLLLWTKCMCPHPPNSC